MRRSFNDSLIKSITNLFAELFLIVKLSVILILRLKCIALKKDIINVSLLSSVKPSKTNSFHQERRCFELFLYNDFGGKNWNIKKKEL